MAEFVHEFSIGVEQIRDYEFLIRFDRPPSEMVMDEPPPLGRDAGPNAARILAAAIGNCLSASMLFCSRKAGIRVERIQTAVKARIVRNENRRLRVGSVDVTITPRLAEPADPAKIAQCLGVFEDFCTVTQSIRQGIPVKVEVKGLEAGEPQPGP